MIGWLSVDSSGRQSRLKRECVRRVGTEFEVEWVTSRLDKSLGIRHEEKRVSGVGRAREGRGDGCMFTIAYAAKYRMRRGRRVGGCMQPRHR
jgi:hypothetical protein